jgi:cystathionine beta-synthase
VPFHGAERIRRSQKPPLHFESFPAATMPNTTANPAARAPTFRNVLEMIGNTPLLEITRIDTGPCRLFVKLESLNPGNSIKDRIAVAMVAAAERDGRLKPGGRIVEATAGNTGIALALVAGQKGYRLTVVVPDKMSDEKISHLRAMGAEVVLTRSDVAKGHPEYYQDVAERLARESDGFYVNQFGNAANVAAHYTTTGPEIWDQMEGQIDAFVAGVGSGGTMSGVGRYLRERNPAVELILADPVGSILAPLVNEGKRIEPGSWLVEGIGEDFVPDNLDLALINKGYTIPDREAFHVARDLLRKEGILAGSSVGTLFAAALRYCREQTAPKRVLTLICDNGAKYLSKMYNDFWMIDNGFIDRPRHNDLRDLIARRHIEREDFCLAPETPVAQAIKRMRMFGVSQMAVVDGHDKVVGILDESDILMDLVHEGADAQRPVRELMSSRLETIRPNASVSDLMPIFRADRIAIVADERHFYGLITKIDLINYLRKQLL